MTHTRSDARSAAVDAIQAYLEAQATAPSEGQAEIQWQRLDDTSFAVALPGDKRLRTVCVLSVGQHALQLEAFVMRAPEENREQLYAWLLQRNARMYGVSWAIDGPGDVYLVGRVPLTSVDDTELDRLLGSVLEYADGSFNLLLAMGFGSSIRREWAWRVKNDEPLNNLLAFRHFAERQD